MGALDAVPDLPLGLQKNGEVMDYGGTIKPNILARSNIILYTAGFRPSVVSLRISDSSFKIPMDRIL